MGVREVRVASVDGGSVQRLKMALHGVARVGVAMHLSDLWTLTAGDIVVLDACTPSIHLEQAATALFETRATVVVWGAQRAHRDRLVGCRAERWVFVPQDTTARELAEILGGLL